jgi:DNA-binding beta-propeller fold protein YncE
MSLTQFLAPWGRGVVDGLKMKTAGKVGIAIFGTALMAVSVVLAVLAIPGTPNSTRSLQFQGYIPLPKGTSYGIVTALDYVTIVGRSLYVTSVFSGDVYRVILPVRLPPSVPEVSVFSLEPAAHGVAVDPTIHLAFVTRSGANTVDVFDPDTMRLLTRISVAEDPDAIIYDPYDKLMYVTNGDAKVATLIDPVSRTKVGVIPLGGEPEYPVFDPQTSLIYQNLKDTNAVAAVDVAKRSVVMRWPLPGCDMPTGDAIDATDRRLFVVCARTARLVAFDLTTHQVVASLPIGGLPDSVAYDPELHRIYTTGLAGLMSVVQQDAPDTYRLLDSVHLHFGAHTLAIDPVNHRVYAAYASVIAQPRLAVFTAAR